jgi:4'-phosphopantetheinyl transferase EntD
VIDELLPPEVRSAEAFDDPQDATLFPEEEAAVCRAVDKRRREFTTARMCARAAMAQLGLPPAPVVPGPRHEPQWPPSTVGSITHCAGYRAAAMALAHDIVTVGIDAEPNAVLPPGVLETIALPEERDRLGVLGSCYRTVCWDRLLFSAKEAVYKAWFPLTRRWLDFHEAAITFSPHGGEFTASLLVPGPLLNGSAVTTFAGRWLVHGGFLVTAIVLPAGSLHHRTGSSCTPNRTPSYLNGSRSTGEAIARFGIRSNNVR